MGLTGTAAGLGQALVAVPDMARWALALVGIALGLPAILWPDAILRAIRKWLLVQLRWVRKPVYRRLLKIYGWLLLVTGALLAALLLVRS